MAGLWPRGTGASALALFGGQAAVREVMVEEWSAWLVHMRHVQGAVCTSAALGSREREGIWARLADGVVAGLAGVRACRARHACLQGQAKRAWTQQRGGVMQLPRQMLWSGIHREGGLSGCSMAVLGHWAVCVLCVSAPDDSVCSPARRIATCCCIAQWALFVSIQQALPVGCLRLQPLHWDGVDACAGWVVVVCHALSLSGPPCALQAPRAAG